MKGTFFLLIISLGWGLHLFSQSSLKEIQQLEKELEFQVKTKSKSSINTFHELKSACQQSNNDSLAVRAVDLITDYYIDQQNYYEAVRWYYFAIDSLCNDKLGVCIKIRREFSEIFTRVGNYDKAFELYHENLSLFRKNNRFNAEVLECASIATLYMNVNKMDSAQAYFKKSLEAGLKSKTNFSIVHARNNLGFFYSQLGDFKNAEKQYLEGIRQLENNPDNTKNRANQLALLKGNLGGLYLKHDMPDKGVPMLEEDLKVNITSELEITTGLNAAIELSRYFYSKKNYSKALFYLKTTLKHETKENAKSFISIYYELFQNSLAEGNTRDAKKYFDIYELRRDQEIENIQTEKEAIEKSLLGNILESQLAYHQREIELKEKENKTLEERSSYLQWRSIVIGWSLLIGIIFFIFYTRKRISVLKIKRQLAEKELGIEKLEKEKIDAELKYKNKDLTDFAIDISRKQEILQELKLKLYDLKNSKLDQVETKKEISELIHYANNNMLVDGQLMEFQRNIEEINYRFFDTLKERFPELTELDKQVCALIRLGLSNKEIAIMRNVSYKAVRMSRYRIRKKIHLDSEEDMVNFLKAI